MKLEAIRKRIDEIDRELVSLLEARMEMSLRTRPFKTATKDEEREAAVIEHAQRSRLALLDESFIEQLFQRIMDESKNLQERKLPLVAFQGEHGAYSEMASRAFMPGSAYIPCAKFSEVFEGVSEGAFDFGVVPVENSLEGAVTQVNNLLTHTTLKVIGETIVPVHHCLLVAKGTDYREVREVYSHPQALAQCAAFLERNRLEPRPYYDTAGAARMLNTAKTRAAAIASPLCAQIYDLEILKEHIEDDPTNSTRFLLLSREPSKVPGDKCSIVFATAHKSGELLESLRIFAESHINLTRIASMPHRTESGTYNFFLDFEGSDQDAKVLEVLDKVRAFTPSMLLLGCYPRFNG
ncbi:MAG: prephenate dehydratase [Proteobacteria bacterium]|nr:prephenate dehydratase [Pseudomonadota bacterium]